MKIKKIVISLFVAAIAVLGMLAVSASAYEGLPIRIYADSNVFRTYISGEFTPSYPGTGGYKSTNGKYIHQIIVNANGYFGLANYTQSTIKNSSKTSTTRLYTYYSCDYEFDRSDRKNNPNINNTVHTDQKNDSAQCTIYGPGASYKYEVLNIK